MLLECVRKRPCHHTAHQFFDSVAVLLSHYAIRWPGSVSIVRVAERMLHCTIDSVMRVDPDHAQCSCSASLLP